MDIKFKKLFLMLMFLFPLAAIAGVNLKNGNFYISYTDIVVPGGGDRLEITRTYNSKSIKKGWFGYGWGSDYETFLVVAADGSVIVHENGTGAETRFIPKTPVNAEAAATKIIEAMAKKTGLAGEQAEKLKEKLKNDAELRQSYGTKFGVEGQIAKGTILYSNERGLQQVHRTEEGFERRYNDGKIEYFSEKGRLLKTKDKNGYAVEIKYNKEGTVHSVKDTLAKQLFFEWYPEGAMKSVWSVDEKKGQYQFKDNNLVESQDVSGNIYKYAYDNNHNMTSIEYQDKTKMLMEYEPKTQFANKITDRNGEVTKYSYESNPSNPDLHYWTIVTKKDLSGKELANRYEYELKVRPDGSQYTYRIYTDISGIKTETVYNEKSSLPLKITRGDHVTTFEYNDKGLLTGKTSSKGDFVKLEYHPEWNKISRVVNNEGWTNFEYDNKGNLNKAVNSEDMAVLLIYDRNGRITKMVDDDKKSKNRRTLAFKYNAMGKPVEIVMDKVGKINVEYDNYGEIKKVDSSQGQAMALQVTQAFQRLLTIVKPAGVNLSL